MSATDELIEQIASDGGVDQFEHTDEELAAAETWFNDTYPGDAGLAARTTTVHLGHGDSVTSVSRMPIVKERIAMEVDKAYANVEQNRQILMGEISVDESWYQAQGRPRKTALQELAATGADFMQQYQTAGAELQTCLDQTTADLKRVLPNLMQDIRLSTERIVGTDFRATLESATPPLATGPFPRAPISSQRYTTYVKLSTTKISHQHLPRFYPRPAGETPESVAALKRGTYNNPAHELNAQWIDVAVADQGLLKWPNWPFLQNAQGTQYDDPIWGGPNYTGGGPGTINLAQEYLGAGTVPTKHTGTWTNTSDDNPGYPVGWATILASIIDALERGAAAAMDSPTYTEYEDSSFEMDDYAQRLLNIGLLWNWSDVRLAAGSSQWDALASSGDAGERGFVQNLDLLIHRNFSYAVGKFAGSSHPGAGQFGEQLEQLKEQIVNAFNRIWGSLKCQIEAVIQNRKNDQELERLLGTGVAGTGSPYAIEAAAQARRLAIAQVMVDFAGENAAQDAAVVDDILDNRNVLFKEQCFLLNYINVFLKQKIDEDAVEPGVSVGHKRLPYATTLGWPEIERNSIPEHQLKENNASLLVSGDAYGFLNKMTLNPHLKHLINIENHDLSLLQPSIRLYKVVYDEFGNDDYQVEINFDSHFSGTDLSNFTSDRGNRGAGVGIQNFTFSYEGSNPFAIKKSIKANLKIFGATFGELLQKRDGKAQSLSDHTETGLRKFKYVDLALKTGRADHGESEDPNRDRCVDIREQNENLADLNFRLRAEVGWAPISNETAAELSPELITAIQSSYVTLNLTPTVHNFDFDEKGQVVMNINYLAYIEEYFDNKNFSIFANAKTGTQGANTLVTLERLKRSIALEDIAKKCGTAEDGTATASEVKEDFKSRITEHTSAALRSLVTGLIERDEVNFMMIEKAALRDFMHNNSEETTRIVEGLVLNSARDRKTHAVNIQSRITAALAEYETSRGGTPHDEDAPEKDAVAAALIAGDGETTTISYFYLSRLVDLILENIGTELEELSGPHGFTGANDRNIVLPAQEDAGRGNSYPLPAALIDKTKRELANARDSFKRLRIILGPVEFVNAPSRVSSKVTNATFGDIPISVKYFVEYLTEKMLKKEEVFYSLTKFLNDLMNEFVRDFLNSRECFRNMKTKVRAQQASLTSWSPDKKHDVLSIKIARTGTRNPILQSARGSATGGMPQRHAASQFQMDHTSAHRGNIDMLRSEHAPVLYLSGPPGYRTAISPDHEFNYFVYFAGQIQPIEKMRGRRVDAWGPYGLIEKGDESRGIFHYMLGRDKGLIKNISLSKTQTRGLAEVRFEQDGYDGLRQLRVVYDVEISSYANINTYPGTYIYVDPAGFDPGYDSDKIKLSELGLGGYYMIIRSEHDFGPGKANTKITAKWVNQIEAAADQAACQSLRDANSGTNDRVNTACEGYVQEREEAAAVDHTPPDRLFDLRWDGWTPW